jgi:hypothetical protein
VTAGWWGSSPTVDVLIHCAESQHRLRWERGDLRALDHGDADGERILAALGGERPDCIAALESWARHQDDLRVLTLASRGPGDVIHGDFASRARWRAIGSGVVGAMVRPLRPQTRRALVARAALQRPHMQGPPSHPEPDDDLMSLYGLSPSLWDRLVATVIHLWSDRLPTLDRSHPAYPALTAALVGRATLALRSWLGRSDLDVVVEMIPADARPDLTQEGDRLTARLPFRWLDEIWAAGAVVTLGRFTLGRLESQPDLERLLTVGHDVSDIRTVTARLERAEGAPGS